MAKTSKPIIKHIFDFLEYCEVEKGLSVNTQENYARFLAKFSRWLKKQNLADLKPHQLTDKHIWDYRLFLSRHKDPRTGRLLKKTTQNYYLIALRALLAYFVAKDIKSLPPDKIILPKLTDKDKQIKFLKLDQIEKLMRQPDINKPSGLRDRAILETLFSTGMRVSELVSLNINQFNFDLAAELIKSKKSYELNIIGKGGRQRIVFFSPRALWWLQKYIATRQDNDKALFINYRSPAPNSSRRLTVRSVDRILAKYVAQAGLPIAATPHSLRHSFATDLLSQGAGLREVQELLGHKNISTTQIYTHITNKKLKEIHEKYHSGRQKEP